MTAVPYNSVPNTAPTNYSPFLNSVGESFNYLSPQEMIAMVSAQLRDIDHQIREKLTAIEADRGTAAEFQRLAAKIREMKEMGDVGRAEMIAKLKQDTGLMENSDTAAMINTLASIPIEKFNGKWLEEKAQSLDQQASEHASNVDVTMIRLQNLVQRRTQTISFASNVINSMNEAAKSVIANMRG